MPAAVLYEQDPNNPQGKRITGTVVWQAGMMAPAPGHPAEMTVRADVEVPERKLAMTWLLRRNTNQDLPITYTIELMFSVPAASSFGASRTCPAHCPARSSKWRRLPFRSAFRLLMLNAISNCLTSGPG